MKYFDLETVVNSYDGFQNCMTNKSWGYLALLKGCKSTIQPLISYEVNMDEVANFLENIFNLDNIKKKYEGGRSLFVVFSKKWDDYFYDQGKYLPNIYDIIVWAYRRKTFSDDITSEDLLKIFSEEFNIPINVINDSFDTQKKNIHFVNELYSEYGLKNSLKQIGVNTSSNNIDAKKSSVVASPGEISRGPFIQTLYAGLEITDYVLILQSNYNLLYIDEKVEENNEVVIDKDDKHLRQKIFYGAPGTGKSRTIKDKTINAEKNERLFRTTFHPDSDYSTFVGCYKPSMRSKDKIYSAEELAVKLKEIKNTGVTYPCHKFAAQYWRSLKDLSADTIKQILNACGFTESMNVEISKGVAIGQEYINKEEGKIIYTFTPQAFTNAYVKSWKTTEEVYLIIEEINRGNCAQIFGDLFQLLDRDDEGKSEYPIDADTDLGSYIAKELVESARTDFPDGVKDGKKLVLPKNLYIWATMNTSDQSLFPIDSAFKRRWEWQYMPIEKPKDKDWIIKFSYFDEENSKEVEVVENWWDFLVAINEEVFSLTHSEDKQLGYFFAKAKDGIIDAETLVNKVYFYLWTDVFKDYDFDSQKAFRKPNSNEPIAFKDFFKDGKVNRKMAEQVILNLRQKKL